MGILRVIPEYLRGRLGRGHLQEFVCVFRTLKRSPGPKESLWRRKMLSFDPIVGAPKEFLSLILCIITPKIKSKFLKTQKSPANSRVLLVM